MSSVEAQRVLIEALGIDHESHAAFVAWCLAEELVAELTRLVAADHDHLEVPLWNRSDGLKRFRTLLQRFTRHDWSVQDVDALFARVQLASEHHERKPIEAGDLLRLLWTQPHECKKCGRRPPEVILHVDHVFPASRGGSSNYENLQFLCAEHNRQKSNKLEVSELWLECA